MSGEDRPCPCIGRSGKEGVKKGTPSPHRESCLCPRLYLGGWTGASLCAGGGGGGGGISIFPLSPLEYIDTAIPTLLVGFVLCPYQAE